jgi:hypothetical protein
MKRLSILTLVFSLAFMAFFIGPSLLSNQFAPYPLMKNGDVLDLLTPIVLIPLYWALYRLDGRQPAGMRDSLIFMVFAAFWIMGQGMHLAANSIGHLLENMKSTDIYNLTNFYDEVLGHYLWHFGILALSGMLIYQQWKNPLTQGRPIMWALVTSGVFYGFAYFVVVTEGSTTPMGVPFAMLAALWLLVWGRKNLGQQPILTFFLVAYLLAIVLFLGWGIYWHGLPEFSKVGIIK